MILGSGLVIMEAGQPPRATFVNYPLGFESGRFQDKVNQVDVVRDALKNLDAMTEPGIIKTGYEWLPGWEMLYERERGKLDHRSPRDTTPQYQTEEDRILAEGS